MKKKITKILEFVGHILIYFSCYFNLPRLCAYLINISILKNKIFKNKLKSKRIVIVLDRAIGHRDIEIIQESSNKAPEFLFLRRSITKIILFYFCHKKKIFFNYVKPPINEKDYFNQNKNNRDKHEKFWSDIIFYLKQNYKNKILNFVTFNYTYFSEAALYFGCKNNNIPVKLWHKEGIKTDLEAKLEAKTWGKKYCHIFKYFHSISTYNNLVKNMFIDVDKSNSKKIFVNGCPRINDYFIKKKYKRKINNVLFLSFDIKRGIPKYERNINLNWQFSYDKVIEILNELSDNKKLNIVIKKKSNSSDNDNYKINKRIKIFKIGTAKNYINQADIIIGHNSASTIEALINGKHVMIPFFEKNLKLKKYLYNFNKELIYPSEKLMKKKILSLINKKASFPLNNKKHQKTVQYYLGNSKNITQKYLKFLNS